VLSELLLRRGIKSLCRYSCCWGNQRERDHWGDQDIVGRIILRWIFRKWDGVVGTGRSWLRIGQVAGACEYGNELLGSIKCWEFLD
jgi:hypothetical protein